MTEKTEFGALCKRKKSVVFEKRHALLRYFRAELFLVLVQGFGAVETAFYILGIRALGISFKIGRRASEKLLQNIVVFSEREYVCKYARNYDQSHRNRYDYQADRFDFFHILLLFTL